MSYITDKELRRLRAKRSMRPAVADDSRHLEQVERPMAEPLANRANAMASKLQAYASIAEDLNTLIKANQGCLDTSSDVWTLLLINERFQKLGESK